MPTYAMTGKDGKTYQIDGPPGLKVDAVRAEILKRAPQAGQPPQGEEEESLIEKIPIVGGALSAVADLPLKAIEGAAGVTKTITDVFGADNAASDAMESVSTIANRLTSAQSRGDAKAAARIMAEAENKGVWENVKAAAEAFWQAPLDFTASAAGSAIPFVAAGLATEGTAVPGMLASGALGAASGAGMIKGDIYDAVYEEFSKHPGVSPEQAEAIATKAQEYSGKNLDQIALGTVIGAAAAATGVPRQLVGTPAGRAAARLFGRKIAEAEVKDVATEAVEQTAKKGLARRVAKEAVEEGVPEGIQAGHERFAQNTALQREGVDVDTWKGVAGQAALEGIMGGVLGGGLGGLHGGHGAEAETKAKEEPILKPETEGGEEGGDLDAKDLESLSQLPEDKAYEEAYQRQIARGMPHEVADKVAKDAVRRAGEFADQREAAQAKRKPKVPPPPGTDVAESITPAPPVEAVPDPIDQMLRRKEQLEQMTGIDREKTEAAARAQGDPADVLDDLDLELKELNNTIDAMNLVAPRPAVQAAKAAEAAAMAAPEITTQTEDIASEQMPTQAPPAFEPTGMIGGVAPVAPTPQVGEEERPVARPSKPGADLFGGLEETAPTEAAPAPVATRPGRARNREAMAAQGDIFGVDNLKAQAAVTPEQEAEAQASIDEQQAQYQAEQEAWIDKERELLEERHKDEDTAGEEGPQDYKSYTVVYRPGAENPYQVLAPGPKPGSVEVALEARDQEAFMKAVDELDPYIPYAEEGAREAGAPTAGTQALQKYNETLDKARERGEITAAELKALRKKQQRTGTDEVNDKGELKDPVARAEKRARTAQTRMNNARTAEQRKAATEELHEASKALRDIVREKITEPGLKELDALVAARKQTVGKAEGETAEAEKAIKDLKAELAEIDGSTDLSTLRKIRAGLVKRLRSAITAKGDTERQFREMKKELKEDILERKKLQHRVADWKGRVEKYQSDYSRQKLAEAEKALDDHEFGMQGNGREYNDLQRQFRGERAVLKELYASIAAIDRRMKTPSEAESKASEIKGYIREFERSAIESRREANAAKATRLKKGPLGAGVAVDKVKAVIDAVTHGWKKNPFKVYKTFNDLPLRVQLALGEENADAYGTAMDDGYAYIIADNLTSVGDIKAVLFHEALGHLGLTQAFGKDLDRVLNELHDGNKNLQEATAAWKANPVNKGTYARLGPRQQHLRAIEEVLANMSQQGRITNNLWQKLVAFVRKWARKINPTGTITVSNADVMNVLARAHDSMIKGKKGKPQRGFELGTDVARLMRANDDYVSIGARKIEIGDSTKDVAGGIVNMLKGHEGMPYLAGVAKNFGSIGGPVLEKLLKALPTSGITNWLGERLGSKELGTNPLQELTHLVEAMHNMRTNLTKESDKIARRIETWINKHGSPAIKAMSKIQRLARIERVRPTDFKNLDDAMANDSGLNGIADRILKNSNDKKLARAALDTMIAESKAGHGNSQTVSNAINALQKTAINTTIAPRMSLQYQERVAAVRGTMEAWAELGKYEGGQKIYAEMRQFYNDMYEAELALLDARIDNLPDKEAADSLRKVRAELMAAAGEPTAEQKAHDPFWDLPAEWFSKDYFPFMREGKYWFRVKGNAKPGVKAKDREFYQFESAYERDQAMAKRAKELGLDPDSTHISAGDNVEELAQTFKTDDAMLQQVFEKLGKFKKNVTLGTDTVQSIIDDVYQVWLMSAPERAVRRRFLHADEVAGMSDDVLLHFQKNSVGYANQLSKMSFGDKIYNHIDQMRQTVSGMPFALQPKLNLIVSEMEKRAQMEVNPPDQSALVNRLNTLSFTYYLTSGATAMTQLTSVPIRTLPRLWKDFGYAKGTSLFLKYSKAWSLLGFPKWNSQDESVFDRVMPGIGGSKMIKNNALLDRAFKAGEDRNAFGTTMDQLTANERTIPTGERGPVDKALKLAGKISKSLGVLFTGAEGISRQVSYMMAFEAKHEQLMAKNYQGYLKAAKANKDTRAKAEQVAKDQVFNEAVDYAINTVGDTTGRFTSFERPSMLRSDWARALTLFKAYPIAQTQWMIGATRSLVKSAYGSTLGDPKQKAAYREELAGTMREVSGVMMTAGLFGGLVGLPLYTAMTYALMAAMQAGMDDDDEMRYMMKKDPRIARDPDLFFRDWLKDKLGAPTMKGIDGRDHRLSSILLNGPISELSDTNIGSRTSLDLKNMWFRDTIKGDTALGTLGLFAVGNVAGASMLAGIPGAYDEFYNGEPDRAMQKLLPAFFRSWVSLYQMKEEGITSRKGDVIMGKEDFNAMNQLMTLIGFRSQRLSDWQDRMITREANWNAINDQRTHLMQQFDKLVFEGASGDEVREYINGDVAEFNRRYPNPNFYITYDALKKSLTSFGRNRAMKSSGMRFSKKDVQMGADQEALEDAPQ